MTTIDFTHITECAPHVFATDASDLYDVLPVLRQGWPGEIQTVIGNRQPLIRERIAYNADGDVTFMEYRQYLGCAVLKIFND
jgi:hypothetical protein